ncbi:MAG: hypothetical protein IAG13_02115 [Deltaproteobacteria bacterium]|nr:hypothetical protein [Nannocystaceae bacterium]
MTSAQRLLLHLAALATAVAACDKADVDSASTASNCDGSSTSSGDGAAVPIAIDCSFVFAEVQHDVTYAPADARTDTALGGKLIASGMLSDPEYEGRSFSLSIYAEDGTVGTHTLYQLDRTRLPVNEFFGDHGFTGLGSVNAPDGDDGVQFACFARDPSDPPHAWEN